MLNYQRVYLFTGGAPPCFMAQAPMAATACGAFSPANLARLLATAASVPVEDTKGELPAGDMNPKCGEKRGLSTKERVIHLRNDE